MGACAYNLIDNFKEDLNGSVVEIGTERGEGSTKYLSTWSLQNNNKFYTVDFDKSRPIFSEKHINQFYTTGESFFENIFPTNEKICFAYLDGFDWIWGNIIDSPPDWINDQIQSYKEHGLEMNNINSQLSCLNLTINVHKYAADKCIILMDDTFLTHEQIYSGKGGAACIWLLSQGWNRIHTPNMAVAFKNW